MKQQQTSSFMVVIGMINGMIGGVILVLPLLVLEAGSIGSCIVIIISGIFSYYSCMLCVKHLGQFSDLNQSIMHHFAKSRCLKIFYDLIVFLNLFLLLILYFKLIVQQWQGMFCDSIVNSVTNFFVLLTLVVIMKYYEFGVSLLAYGIISCVGYCLFLIWVIVSAPNGSQKIPTFGKGMVTLAASMGQAFSIQTIFIPILRKNKSQNKYQLYTIITFIAGFCVYMYIAYMGAYGLINRTPFTENPQTIQQYFGKGYWQLYILQIIYLIHLYSVFPEFLIISNKRLFSIFGKQMAKKRQINIWEIGYTAILIGVCLAVSLSNVEIGDIIQLNGAVIGFFFIYFLPSITHIQCLYINPRINKNRLINVQNKQIQITQISTITSQQNMRISLITQREQKSQYNSTKNKIQQQKFLINQANKQCVCDAVKYQLPYAIFDWIMLIGMLATGSFIMYEGISNVFS